MNYRKGYEFSEPSSDPVIFALGLRRQPSRAALIRQQLETLGMPWEMFYGTDAAEPGALLGVPSEHLIRTTQPGAVGCAWSHWRIASEIVNRGMPYGIIAEDDAVLTCSRREVEDALRDLPPSFDLAVMHRSSWEQPVEDRTGHTRLWRRVRIPSHGTQFFALSNNGARRLISEMLPISNHIDMWFRERTDWSIYQHAEGLAVHSLATPSSRDNGEAAIPRHIHQIWLGGSVMPERMVKWGRTWDSLNERAGYRRFVWTEADFEMEIPDIWSRVRRLPVIMQADIMRLAILARRGGVYVDTDFECLREVHELLKGRIVWGEEKPGFTSTGFLAAEKDHHIIHAALEEALDGADSGLSVVDATGPGMFRRVVENLNPMVLSNPDELEPVYGFGQQIGVSAEGMLRLNAETIYPYGIGERWNRSVNPQAFAVHHWEKSWWVPEPTPEAILAH